MKKTTTYDVAKPSPGLGQSQTFSGDKSVNLIPTPPPPLNNWISNGNSYINKKAVIVWSLDLQLSMQSVPLPIGVVSSNLDQDKVYNIM